MKSYNELIAIVKNPPTPKVDIAKIISQQRNLPLPIVKRGIKQGQLRINNKPIGLFEIELRNNVEVTFQNIDINIEKYREYNQFDLYIELVLRELGEEQIVFIKNANRRPFNCYGVAYFANNPLDQIVESESLYLDAVVNELENFYKDYFKENKDIRIPKRKELIERLINSREENISELISLVTNLIDNTYVGSLYKFLQEYTRIINKESFQNMVAPIITSSLYTRAAIDALIKPISEARSLKEIEEKFIHFDANQNVYLTYFGFIDTNNGLHTKVFKKIGEYLFDVFKRDCDTAEIKPASIHIESTARKYNFNNQGRSEYDLFLNIINRGEGLGREVKISSESEIFHFEQYNVGILKPGDSREISISTTISKEVKLPILALKCSWIDLSGVAKEKVIEVAFDLQTADIPWELLEKRKPYTIQEIEDKEKLYGRDEILFELEKNIQSDIIESYKIWGQKRVGKSSIVKTLRSLFNGTEKIIVVWRSIAGLKNIDPILTLNTLGESICSEIFEEIDRKLTSSGIKESLRQIAVPEFKGSLSPLELYIKKLKRIDKELRFVFIIDEFDRINEEFFLPGSLGDSFSLNIGKGLNSLNYVGFILVGSENMHLLDRQEMNYNSFQNREVDTFNRQREFESFRKIVTGPVAPYISYTDEAVEKIYEVTNGNPYFANLICSNVFNICSRLKDNEVDINTVVRAIKFIVDSYQKSHFEHFWADGITEESTARKERKADIRRRLLVSYSFCYFQTRNFPTKQDVVKNFRKPLEYDVENYEIENTITEFYNRKIFVDEKHLIRIRPSIFEMWLCGPGRTLMIEGVSDLEALQREKQLEIEHALRPDELQRICNLLLFKGEKQKVQELTQYFNQFGGPFEQRRIYNLLDRIYYVPKSEIIDFLKSEQRNIFAKSELTIKSEAKSAYRENVEIYSFPHTLDENSEVFESFKLLSLIRKTKTLKCISTNKDAWKSSGADDIVIYESIIDDFALIQPDLLNFFDERLVRENLPVKLVVLVITSKAKADLIKATSGIANFKLIHFKEIEESKIRPFADTTEVFETLDESRYAFAEVRKQYHETSKDSLNVLFETHCPGKSIPIYWHSTRQFKAIFPNPNGVVLNIKKQDEGELNRARIYHANTALSQKLNSFIVNELKEKAKRENKDDWFRVEYIPKSVLTVVSGKWIQESQDSPKESYFDFLDYKKIIELNKELTKVFTLPGEGLTWCDKLNVLRRDPAHPEKPAPSLEDVEYFEKIKDQILSRLP